MKAVNPIHCFTAMLVAWAMLTWAPQTAKAQDNNADTLVVVAKPIAPFVMKQNDQLQGFSIDLWKEIATRGNFKSEFVYVETLGELLDRVQSGKVDAAIAAISVTGARETKFDFSHSYFSSGLQILVAKGKTNLAAKVWLTIVSILTSHNFLIGIGLFISFVFLAGNLFWLAERKSNKMISSNYLHGIWDSFWWSLVTVATVGYGDVVPKSQLGRLFSIMWIISGFLGFAWFTALITSTVTISQLTGSIDGPSSLAGRTVATIDQSTSATWLKEHVPGIVIVPRKKIETAYNDLSLGKVEAVVFDAPTLLYYAANQGSAIVRTAGSVFHKEDYAIAFPPGSPLREKVNQILLNIREDGTHAELMEKWFGVAQLP